METTEKDPPIKAGGHQSNSNADGIKVAQELVNKTGDENQTEESNEEEKVPTGPKTVSMFELFRYAEGTELLLLFVGIVAAWATGLCMPIMTILFGNLSDALVTYGGEQDQDNMALCLPNMTNSTNATTVSTADNLGFDYMDVTEFQHQISVFGIGLTIVGVVQMVLSYIFVSCLNSAAERQIYRIRNLFLASVLKQDIAWYDTHQTGEFASRVSDDLAKFQDGIGEKIGMFNFFCSCFIFSIITAFVHGWQLTLVMLSVTPIMAGSIAVLGIVQARLAKNEFKAYAVAGAVAEEVLTAIRTVVAFGGEEKEAERYTNNLAYARKAGINRGLTTGVGAGILWLTIYGSYALAFWYGVKLIVDERGKPNPKYDPSNLITVFFSVFMGAITIGRSTPYIEAFSQARAAAAAVFEVIDRVPPIDSTSEEGHRPESITGNLEFENIHFSYPSRPNVPILTGLNLKINKGETVALVGESGCGKSTTVQLLQRFYDPEMGTVRLDGHDIKQLNIGWLRDHIGIVGQEPILFGTTIAENIRYGLEDDASQEEIETAGKKANAHNFIMKLPKKYETLVGDRGAQLSGGQKQRVAIARALIKDPKILLLDEATSALDSESEAVVQHALDKARQGRTTIIIAHRLSTIRNADKIAAFSQGRIVELGTHEELMAKKGVYYMLVTTQTGGDKDKDAPMEVKEIMEAEDRKMQSKDYARNLSINSANSAESITEGVMALARVPSIRRRKHGEYGPLDELEEEEETILRPSLLKLIKQNSPEGFYLIMGCIGALGMGFSTPVFSIIFGDIMGVLSSCDNDEVTRESIKYACMFLILGVCTGIFMFLQIFMFAYAGQYLTQRLRKLSFAKMLKQEIGWFDNPNNSVGGLCTRLSSDASSVQLATGSTVGNILQALCTLFASTIIALCLCWQLALVSSCFIPLALAIGYYNGKMIRGQTLLEMVSLDNANKIAIEAIANIRTVASLHKERKFIQMYKDYLQKPHIQALQYTHLRGMIYGFASSITYFNYAATMYYGGTLIVSKTSDYETVFKVAELLIMGTQMLSQAFSFAPNASKGVVAASRIFALLERKSNIDSGLDGGLQLPDDTPGQIEFKGAKFHYPTRPDVPVLRNLNLTIKPGQMVALVGSSGCGKSTCIQLLERFYDPKDGVVQMDSNNIKELNIKWLRSRIGIVSQEPILFDCSIADNIAYGDNSRLVEMGEVIDAAVNANIHTFISTLPKGYETSVGDKGAQLSGGQKQRIAIARALVRNPKILLLDEATSALDSESEKVVQEALEKAQKGRTCITVAHRLSTIKDADQIAVIHQGEVVEIGTHDELIAKQGHYYRFYQTQAKGRV